MALVALLVAATVNAQTAGIGRRTAIFSSGEATPLATESSQIVREIDDPHLGTRWLLMRDPVHPAGPGRLVMISLVRGTVQVRQTGAPASEVIANPLQPVIHAGDRVIVEENSPVVEARLEAVALGPAALGSALEVRLKIGGLVVRAIARGPGRAALQPEIGVRP
jgi:hypothetical protein